MLGVLERGEHSSQHIFLHSTSIESIYHVLLGCVLGTGGTR